MQAGVFVNSSTQNMGKVWNKVKKSWQQSVLVYHHHLTTDPTNLYPCFLAAYNVLNTTYSVISMINRIVLVLKASFIAQ